MCIVHLGVHTEEHVPCAEQNVFLIYAQLFKYIFWSLLFTVFHVYMCAIESRLLTTSSSSKPRLVLHLHFVRFLRRSFWLSANTAHPSMFCISWDFPQPSLTVKHTPVTESTVCLPTESATSAMRHKKQHSSTDAEKSTNASVRKAAAAKEPSTERKICTRGKRWSTAWTLWYEYPPCTCSQTRSCSLSTSTYACCFSVFFVTPLSPVKWTTFDLSFKFYWTLAASAESGLSCKLYITLGVPMWRKFWPHFFHFALQVLLFLNIFW